MNICQKCGKEIGSPGGGFAPSGFVPGSGYFHLECMETSDDHRSVVLGLVAAKIAIAEIQSGRTFKSADDAFEAIRVRMNELIGDSLAKAPQR